ncbi:MAG: endonuclease MutS2 [Clostridium sp.]|uniref:endonuclease MutS2 n=1 Tax=Clostridium culturomicium TaxID=1499683 RepID=UPI00290F8C80|nr:endonuclease MutS2 [Clostridium sp.]MDU7082422.1 endonuclease MutS2 [Clostridium sp.]
MNEKTFRVLEYHKIKEILKKYTKTTAAKDIIDGLQPYTNLYEIKEHLEETKEALILLTTKGAPPFEGIYDVREALLRAKKNSTLMPVELLRIGNMLKSSRNFKEYVHCKDDEEKFRVLEDIVTGIVPFKNIEDDIFRAILSEEEIADNASDTLFIIRKKLKDKSSSIKERVTSMVRTYSKYLQENLYTIRGDRYVLPVKIEYKEQVKGLVHDQSATGSTLFIEPMGLVDLNNEIKELRNKEKAEINRILKDLTLRIAGNIDVIQNNGDIVWELDFIFAKAKYANELNCVCPAVNDKGIIDLIEARHPLIDQKVVVPSNIYLGREFTSLVITGPNTGGKTVTLKTVGLIELMAMSGLMIPARDGSTVSVFNKVFADIGDEQSIEQSLSTFSSHMTNIVNIIGEADENTLALFDELGSGTDPTEGAALAMSILDNLRDRGTKIMATTHYSELKGYALKTMGVENGSVEFDVETLRPTYKLLIGVPGKSNAFEISRRLGLPEYIIGAAKDNISTESLKFEELIQNLQAKSIKAENDARYAESLKQEAEKLKGKYEEKLYKLEKVREKAMYDAQREAKDVIKAAKEEADSIVKNIRDLERLGYSSEARTKIEKERKKIKDSLDNIQDKLSKKDEPQGEALTSVKPGEEVFLPSLNQNVTVLSEVDNKGEVQVQAGIMKISVKLKDLRKGKVTAEDKKKAKMQRREAKLNMKAVSSSVDLRGMDSQEAIYTTDKYLDEAYLGGLGEVTIIHGNGTGVLKKSINDLLRSHPHVKSYRLGSYGEGGTGVTIAVLK